MMSLILNWIKITINKRSFIALFSLLIFSFCAGAQIKNPCINNKMNVDFSCQCITTNSCYKSMSKIDKKVYKRNIKTKFDKKLFSIVKKAYKLEDDLFSRKVDITDKRFKEIAKTNAKLSKYNNKKRKAYEKMLKAKGAKTWRIKDRVQKVKNLWKRLIPKDRYDYLLKYGPENSLGKMMAKNAGVQGFSGARLGGNSLKATEDLIKAQIVNSTKVAAEEVISDDMGTKDVITAAREAKNSLKNKNYKVNDIHLAHKSIWKVLSARYIRVQNRLDKNAILAGSQIINKDNVQKSIIEQLNMM